MIMNPVIFREYDIRGVVNEDFDSEFARNLGRALTAFTAEKQRVENPTITLGHDARLSSPELIKALASGILESGGNVIHLGLVTTPISYFTTFTLPEVNGAIMVTGSHNPPEYNGFKISVGKGTIFGDEIKKLETIIKNEAFISGEGSETDVDIFPSYIARYKEEFGNLAATNVVLDCGNGTAGCVARLLFNAVGLDPVILFEEPDGTFPNHHPDPTVEENLEDLKVAVKKHGAVAGIGFDGDTDRIGVVDGDGNMVYGDELIALWSRYVLKENPGAIIIGDVKCSDRLFADIEKHGGKPIMWKTGHSLVKQKIKDEKAPFGGELSGHVFFADRNYGYDDALYAALRLVEILAQTGGSVRDLLEGFPPAFNTPELRIDTTEEKKHSIVNRLKEVFGEGGPDYKVNLIDGLRISFKNGWALARPSNTQPVLVLRFESSTEEGLESIKKRVYDVVNPLL